MRSIAKRLATNAGPGTGAVVDYHQLAPHLLKLLDNNACQGICRGTSGGRHDDLDRPGGLQTGILNPIAAIIESHTILFIGDVLRLPISLHSLSPKYEWAEVIKRVSVNLNDLCGNVIDICGLEPMMACDLR